MRWFGILLVVGAIAGGIAFFRPEFAGLQTGKTSPKSAGNSDAGSSGDRVKIFAGGTVEGSHRELSLKFEIAGRIDKVLVKPGDYVAKGDVLAQLDPELLEMKFTEARTLLKLAHAEHDRLIKSAAPVPQEERTIAEAKVTLAEGALRRERLMLEKTLLVAPMSGLVLRVPAEMGELAGPNDEREVVSLVNRDVARVRAYVEELDALDVAVGQSAVVTADGRPDRAYAGIVQSCSPYVAPKSHRHLKPGELFDIRVREVLIELVDAADLPIGLPVDVAIEPGPAKKSEPDRAYDGSLRNRETSPALTGSGNSTKAADANSQLGRPAKQIVDPNVSAAGYQANAGRRGKKP